MTNPDPVTLSAAGETRRGEMLYELVGAMGRVHRARRVRRRAIAAATPIIVGALLWMLIPGTTRFSDKPRLADLPTPDAAPHIESAAAAATPPLTAIVHTAPNILDRYRAHPVSRIERINDRMLIDTLASIDRPAGLIYYGNSVSLTAPVTDLELKLNR